jgi:hypothetical protein
LYLEEAFREGKNKVKAPNTPNGKTQKPGRNQNSPWNFVYFPIEPGLSDTPYNFFSRKRKGPVLHINGGACVLLPAAAHLGGHVVGYGCGLACASEAQHCLGQVSEGKCSQKEWGRV